jgi:hypothetical protein
MANGADKIREDMRQTNRATGRSPYGGKVEQTQPEESRAGGVGRHILGAVGDTTQALAGGLMKSAFRSFGKAIDGGGYTPRGMRPDESYLDAWEEQGGKAVKALEERWHRNEFSQFRKTVLNKYEADLKTLDEEASYLTKELREGRWPQSDGKILELDYNVEADRMKGMRLKSQVESDATMQLMEMQIKLNNTAAEKYSNNPIIDRMIQQLMESQTQMLASQFQQPNTMAQAKGEQELQAGGVDMDYKKSLTRQSDARTEGLGLDRADKPFKDTASVFAAKGPAEAARYFTNNTDGIALFEAVGGKYIQQMEQAAAAEFVRSMKWNPQEAEQHKTEVQDYVTSKGPGINQRALHEMIKQEYGDGVAAEASEGRPAMRELPAPDFKYDVDVNPGKKETKEKTDKFDALGHNAGNQEMAKDPSMTKEEAHEWVMDEWLPEALEGKDIAYGGAYNEQFEGLTASEKNAAAAPYIKAVRDSLEKALKHLGTGEGTGGLTEAQTPRSMSRGARRRKAMGIFAETAADVVTPDALFPDVGENLFPPDFRKQFPKEDKKKE